MRLFTPSRLVALVALAIAAVSLSVALGVATAGTSHTAKQACVKGQALLERNKANAVAYYETAFNDKNPRRAVELYGGDEYIQHNPLAANGFDAFIAFVEFFTSTYPDLHIDIRRVIAQCDLVVTHGVLSGGPPELFGEFDSKVVDIFRLDENGKIVEHWDVLARQVDPKDSANGNPEV
jgi:predicted SnoaL-like aldol condensation-catalyzing enzyme